MESNSHFENVYLLASGKIHSRDERVAQVSVQYEIIFQKKIGNGLSNERFGILLCFYDFRAILFFLTTPDRANLSLSLQRKATREYKSIIF